VLSGDLASAKYFTAAGGNPSATVTIAGAVVAGDATAVYVAIPGEDAQGLWQAQLWRYPIDGSTPTDWPSSYLRRLLPQLLQRSSNHFVSDGVLKLWSTAGGSSSIPSPICSSGSRCTDGGSGPNNHRSLHAMGSERINE